MKSSWREDLLEMVDEWCDLSGCSEATLGLRAVNHGGFVARLRDGKDPTVTRYRQFLDYLSQDIARLKAAQVKGGTAAATA